MIMPPRRKIVENGITYREVRPGDDESLFKTFAILMMVFFVGMPAAGVFVRWFFVPVMNFISTGHWSWDM